LSSDGLEKDNRKLESADVHSASGFCHRRINKGKWGKYSIFVI